jgi:hypothetical protein
VPILEKIETDHLIVFSKQALSDKNLKDLLQLKNMIAQFYGDNPLEHNQMIEAIYPVLTAIAEYYKSYTGIVPRAGDIIKKTTETVSESIKQMVKDTTDPLITKVQNLTDSLKQQFNGQPHPLLTLSHSALTELLKAISTGEKAAIEKFSKELAPLLEKLVSQNAAVFEKKPPVDASLDQMRQLASSLPHFYGENPLNYDQMTADLNPVYKAVNDYYVANVGVIPSTKDTLDTVLTRVDEIRKSVEKSPNEMIKNVMGKNTSEKTDAVEGEPNSESVDGPREGTVPQFLSHGASLLQTMIEKGGQALTKQALGSFAGVIALGLEQDLGKMTDSSVFGDKKTTLEQVINNLKDKAKSGDWKQLRAYLELASKALSGVKLYVNGFRIPSVGSDPSEVMEDEDVLSENINALQNAVNGPAGEVPNTNWKDRAETEKDKLVGNAANYLTIKHVYENVCGLKPDNDTFYVEMLNRAKKEGGENWESKLQELFFEKINQKNVNIVWRLWAKIAYFFYGIIVTKFTKEASKIYFKEIFDYIQKNKGDQFNTIRGQVTKNFTRYLTILGGAYNRVAKKDPDLLIEEMLKTELEKKELNLGFETQDLYKEFAQTVITKTLWGSSILGWIGKKLIGDPEEKVRRIVDLATGSLQDTRGYTHAMNLVIHEQIEDIWLTLQAQEGKKPLSDADLSKGHKAQLSGLVKNLFEVLERNNCDTIGELKDLVDGKSTKAKVNQAIDGLFMDDVLEKVTHILGASIQTIAKEDQLQKLTYRFASLVNNTFEGNVVPDAKTMQETEDKIAARCSQILRMAVRSAVSNKFDFSGKKEQTETNQCIDKLEKRSKAHFEKAKKNLEELGNTDLASSAAIAGSKIDTLSKDARDYRTECDLMKTQAKGLSLNGDNLIELDKCYSGIQKQSEPYIGTIAQLKLHARRLDGLEKAEPELREIQVLISTIPMQFSTLEGLKETEMQVKNIGTRLNNLEIARHAARSLHQVMKDTRLKPTILNDAIKVHEMRNYCSELAKKNSLVTQIAQEKKNHLAQIAEDKKNNREPTLENEPLKQLFAALKKDLIEKVDPIFASPLLNKLDSIEAKEKIEDIDSIEREFRALLLGAVDEAEARIERDCFKQISNEKMNEKEDQEYKPGQLQAIANNVLVPIRKAMEARTLCTNLTEPNSLIDQFAGDKKNHLNALLENAEVKQKFETLVNELKLRITEPFHTQLLSKLKMIREAKVEKQIDDALREFREILRTASQAADASIEKGKTDYRAHFENIKNLIATTQLSNPARIESAKNGIKEEIENAKKYLEVLSVWEAENVKPVPYINFFPVDMKWVQDFATKTVYNRVKERTDGFIDLLRREETYRYGLLNHLFLIPYTQAMRSEKK